MRLKLTLIRVCIISSIILCSTLAFSQSRTVSGKEQCRYREPVSGSTVAVKELQLQPKAIIEEILPLPFLLQTQGW